MKFSSSAACGVSRTAQQHHVRAAPAALITATPENVAALKVIKPQGGVVWKELDKPGGESSCFVVFTCAMNAPH